MRRILLASVLVTFMSAPAGVMAEPKMPANGREADSTTDGSVSIKKAGAFFKDTWLTSKTKSRLFADKRAKGWAVHVETREGIVALRGKVASAEERRAAEEIARSTKGVRAVVNALQVVPEAQRDVVDRKDGEITKAVREQLEADAKLLEADISVRSDNGVVTLLGEVPDARTGARAAEVARRIPGVKTVRNETRAR